MPDAVFQPEPPDPICQCAGRTCGPHRCGPARWQMMALMLLLCYTLFLHSSYYNERRYGMEMVTKAVTDSFNAQVQVLRDEHAQQMKDAKEVLLAERTTWREWLTFAKAEWRVEHERMRRMRYAMPMTDAQLDADADRLMRAADGP